MLLASAQPDPFLGVPCSQKVSLAAQVVFSAVESSTETKRWICEACGWIYDPAEGDIDGGVPAGTAFEDIPEDWFCPVCGARKTDFVPYED